MAAEGNKVFGKDFDTAANKADRKMITVVGGVVVIRHENIRFRGKISDQTLINKLMFNTFHGGA